MKTVKCPYCDGKYSNTVIDLGSHLALAHKYEFTTATAPGVDGKIARYVAVCQEIAKLEKVKELLHE